MTFNHKWYYWERKLFKFNGVYLIDHLLGNPNIPCTWFLYKLRAKIAQKHNLLYKLMWNDWR